MASFAIDLMEMTGAVWDESIAAMVGDGRMDMSVGRELGMYCVGVLTGSGDEEQLTNAGADLVIGEIHELLDHV